MITRLTILAGVILGLHMNIIAQSDGCSSATPISVTANCSSPTAGTTVGATQTIPGCAGNADDDVWYVFTATGTSHQITVAPSASMDPVVQLFSGACASLVSLGCMDNYANGGTEILIASGLTPGQQYRLRVYHFGTGSGSGTFTICVTSPPPVPGNNECSTATNLNVNASCVTTNGTTLGATQSLAGCAGNADDDVWYSFVATNSVQNVTVNPTGSMDPVVQVYGGACGSLSSLLCIDNTLSGQSETVNLVGLTPGNTYYIRVYDYYAGSGGNFTICVTGTPTATPTNDDPCSAIQLPAVTASCNYLEFTTVGATATSLGLAPMPNSCVGGSSPQQGGYSTSTSKDIWFRITVPASGTIHITPKPNMGSGSITDGVMVLYSGTCGALTQIACSDDNNFPGSANDLLPLISATGLTPGSTVFLRYFGYGSSQGKFGICVTTATNDNCANALYICDINGYSSSTSAAYTPDRPSNMRGNNEDINGNNMPDGTNTGGIFGQGGPWGTGAPNFDVIINNNSWIRFTASAASATLNVTISDCWVGNYPSGGIQMQIFSANNCTNFVPVSNFEESSTGFVITANGLTIGNDYYLMVDGYAGDICNYTITANSGVQFPDIADVAPICEGETVTLTAPAGATSYEWAHDGSTTQSVTVSPSVTTTYTCEVTGLCDYKQTLDVTVTVKPNPVVTINNAPNTSICAGGTANLIANGANSYSWSNGMSGSNINVSPAVATSYTVTGTINGCTDQQTITVNINPNPTITTNPTATPADCGSNNGALSGAVVNGAPSITYSWVNGSNVVVGNAANLSNIPAGVYTLNVTDGNGCSASFGAFSVTNPGAPPAPTIVVSDQTPCLNSSTSLTASSTTGGATFDWSGPSGFTSTNASVTLNPVLVANQGNYCVTATAFGCTGPAACQTITVEPLPVIDITPTNNDSTLCFGSSSVLSASGGTSYVWNGPGVNNISGASLNITNMDPSQAGTYTVSGTDANGCVNTATIQLSNIPLPNVGVNSSGNNYIFCGGTVVQLQATGANTYSWTGPNSFTATTAQATIVNATELNEGWYYVTGVNSENCAATDSVNVTVVTEIPAASALSDDVVCPGEPVNFSGTGGVTYTWNGPNGFSSSEQNFTLTGTTVQATGWYYLSVVDSNGCLGYDSSYLEINNNLECIFIPELVTPDGNNSNDVWEIQGLENSDNSVEIYNRWGNLIYRVEPYDAPWDGTVNQGGVIDGGGKVPVGTYYYIIRVNIGDEQKLFKGYIEVQY